MAHLNLRKKVEPNYSRSMDKCDSPFSSKQVPLVLLPLFSPSTTPSDFQLNFYPPVQNPISPLKFPEKSPTHVQKSRLLWKSLSSQNWRPRSLDRCINLTGTRCGFKSMKTVLNKKEMDRDAVWRYRMQTTLRSKGNWKARMRL